MPISGMSHPSAGAQRGACRDCPPRGGVEVHEAVRGSAVVRPDSTADMRETCSDPQRPTADPQWIMSQQPCDDRGAESVSCLFRC